MTGFTGIRVNHGRSAPGWDIGIGAGGNGDVKRKVTRFWGKKNDEQTPAFCSGSALYRTREDYNSVVVSTLEVFLSSFSSPLLLT